MLKICVFAVYDSAAKLYGQPFFSQTQATAVRQMESEVNTPGAQVAKYPKDYCLFLLGKYDVSSGMFELEPTPVRVIELNALKKEEHHG